MRRSFPCIVATLTVSALLVLSSHSAAQELAAQESAAQELAPQESGGSHSTSKRATVRIGTAQPRDRSIDFQLPVPEALKRVDASLEELVGLIHNAAEARCDVIVFPEDTLGLLRWEAGNAGALQDVLPKAVDRMLERFGAAARQHQMYVICCNDVLDADGALRNTAFFIGRDGKLIGKYNKVQPTISENRKPGESFPVFHTPDLGDVGMLICYDMVFPESTRCLALAGADIIFVPTLGGAAIGDEDISRAAFRTRAVDNFVYLAVAQRGKGSMIVSPQGAILAEAKGLDDLAIANIDPMGGREGGDAFNRQQDMRARLFRERNPRAYSILTDPHPPVLDQIPSTISRETASRIFNEALTVGDGEFKAAAQLAASGQTSRAIAAFERLCTCYPGTWIDRVSQERIAQLQRQQDEPPACATDMPSIAAKYPGDVGIETDERVVFVENFEQGEIRDLEKRWESVRRIDGLSFAPDVPDESGGKQSLLLTHTGGDGDGSHLYRRLPPGFEKLHARFYVKFDPDCAPIHHFGTHIGGYHPSTPWPQGGAGTRPAGDKTFTVGIEPFGKSWQWDYYTYWCEMRGSPPRGQTWGNSFLGDQKVQVERGRWTCVEVMVKMNDVGDTNGELALWIDGRQVSHLKKGSPRGKWVFDKFLPDEGGEAIRWNDQRRERETFSTPDGGLPFEGFRWRTTDALNLNYLWVYAYITAAPQGHVSRIWYDDIVVATDYIGPLQP